MCFPKTCDMCLDVLSVLSPLLVRNLWRQRHFYTTIDFSSELDPKFCFVLLLLLLPLPTWINSAKQRQIVSRCSSFGRIRITAVRNIRIWNKNKKFSPVILLIGLIYGNFNDAIKKITLLFVLKVMIRILGRVVLWLSLVEYIIVNECA